MSAFGKIPAAVVDAGCLRNLTQAEALTYIMLCRHCDGEDWTCWPSVPLMASQTGLAARSIHRALRSLEGLGLISATERGGGRGRAAVYRVNPDPPVTHSERETLTDCALNGDTRRAKPGPRGHPQQINRENRGAACAARRLEGRRLARSKAEEIRAETVALDPPDGEWLKAEAARYGFAKKPPAASVRIDPAQEAKRA